MKLLVTILSLFFLTACIGEDVVDDYVQPVIRIENPVESIEAGTSYQFSAQFVNNVGQMEDVNATWTSGNTDLLTIDGNGLASAIAEGNTIVSVSFTDEFGETAMTDTPVEIGASTVVVERDTIREGSVATTTFYDLEGNFTLTELPDGNLTLAFGDDYNADSNLPGLFVYLSNNPNDNSQAFEIGRVETFRGAHSYTFSGAGLADYAYVLYYCKPFNVKVGHGDIEE